MKRREQNNGWQLQYRLTESYGRVVATRCDDSLFNKIADVAKADRVSVASAVRVLVEDALRRRARRKSVRAA